MTLVVRPAREDDVETIAVLERECFPEDAWVTPYLRSAVGGEMAPIWVLVAELDGVVVGHAIISVIFEIAELQRIGVTAAARGGGIATVVLDAVVELARTERAERLLLEVREGNVAAQALYEGRGFVEIDRRERYYRDGATAIVLQRDLVEGNA